MTLRITLILCLVSALMAAACTKYYFPSVQTKTVEVTKEVVKTDIQTVVHTVTLPNGAVDTTTTTIDHTQKTELDKKQEIILAKTSTLNLSALAGNDFSHPQILPIYGLSVSKSLLGPITVGAFGLTNGVVGLSVGINF